MNLASRQVDWFAVHEFVMPLLDEVGSWPTAGSPLWAQLGDDDPRKLAAVLQFGLHMALRVDTEQAARAQASQAISAAADWSAVARRVQQGRGAAYIPRKAS